MKTKLVCWTQNPDGLTPEETVAYIARVSNPANQLNLSTMPKLLNYLLKHEHWSPFESVTATVEITTTRAISRQIIRHRSFTFNEFSQRYAEVDDNIVIPEARMQDKQNRQSSTPASMFDQNVVDKTTRAVWKYALGNYKILLDSGIAKEVARAVLPEGLTPTTLFMSGSLRSWIHYIILRAGNGTQKEHADIARELVKTLGDIFPVSMKYAENQIKEKAKAS